MCGVDHHAGNYSGSVSSLFHPSPPSFCLPLAFYLSPRSLSPRTGRAHLHCGLGQQHAEGSAESHYGGGDGEGRRDRGGGGKTPGGDGAAAALLRRGLVVSCELGMGAALCRCRCGAHPSWCAPVVRSTQHSGPRATGHGPPGYQRASCEWGAMCTQPQRPAPRPVPFAF